MLKSYRAADHSKVQTGSLKTFYAINLARDGGDFNEPLGRIITRLLRILKFHIR